MPDWLKGLEPETSSVEADQTTEPVEVIAEEEPIESETPASEWQLETKPAVDEEAPSVESEAQKAELEGQISEAQPEEEIDEGFAWLEGLAARQGADEALLLKPEERMETPPQWVQELSGQEQSSPEEEETLTSGGEADVSEDELKLEPQQLFEQGIIDQNLEEETPDQPEVEVPEQPGEAAVPAMDDADAAFAWLESLAVKQGADEALLLSPEERQETPPDWIQEAQREAAEHVEELDVEEEASLPATEETAIPEMPEWLRDLAEKGTTPPFEPAIDEQEQIDAGAPVEESRIEEIFPEKSLEEQAGAVFEEETFQAEVPAKEQPEDIPDLPEWLAESTIEAGEEEDAVWLPPEGLTQRIDLNEAGLVELEKLPNIGFILAQNIITYRETFGPFKNLEDLENVTGIGPTNIEELKEYIFIEPAQQLEAESPAPHSDLPSEVQMAHDELQQGKLEDAIAQYTHLINSRKHLQDVIQDLQTAIYLNPVEVSLWQTLGDAYLRADQVQEALDAYTKAEQLLS